MHFIQLPVCKDHQWRAINGFDSSLSPISCTPFPVRRSTFPHVCLEPFPHRVSTSHPMSGILQKESWRSIGNIPFKVIFVDKLRTLPCLSFNDPRVTEHTLEEPRLKAVLVWRTHRLVLPPSFDVPSSLPQVTGVQ